MEAVSFFDASRVFAAYRDDLCSAFERVMGSKQLILGPEVEALEMELASFVGSSFAIGVASGTDALELALRALDAEPGAEVICPALTATATATAIVRSGLTPVLVDVDEATLTLSAERTSAAVSAKTAAIVTVHLYGRPAPVAELEPLGLPVIEDAAQAFGLALPEGCAGSVGRIGSFSFYPTKNLAAFGDGGAVVTNDEELASTIRELRAYGERPRYFAVRAGMNSRLDELQAALLRLRLHAVSEENARRLEIATLYDEAIGASTPRGVYHLYVVRSTRRDDLRQRMNDLGVQTLIHYPWTIDQQPAFAAFTRDGDLDCSHAAAAEVLSVPCHPFMTTAEIQHVASALAAAVDEKLIVAYV
jgi:dTDP-3-amino-3,4,6-trideoxy-alpha-D-glucose transaminase